MDIDWKIQLIVIAVPILFFLVVFFGLGFIFNWLGGFFGSGQKQKTAEMEKTKKNVKLEPLNWSLDGVDYFLDSGGVRISASGKSKAYAWNELRGYFSEREDEKKEFVFYGDGVSEKEAAKIVSEVRENEKEIIHLTKPLWLFLCSTVDLVVRVEDHDRVVTFLEVKLPYAKSQMKSFKLSGWS